jgi:hypothetical protein
VCGVSSAWTPCGRRQPSRSSVPGSTMPASPRTSPASSASTTSPSHRQQRSKHQPHHQPAPPAHPGPGTRPRPTARHRPAARHRGQGREHRPSAVLRERRCVEGQRRRHGLSHNRNVRPNQSTNLAGDGMTAQTTLQAPASDPVTALEARVAQLSAELQDLAAVLTADGDSHLTAAAGADEDGHPRRSSGQSTTGSTSTSPSSSRARRGQYPLLRPVGRTCRGRPQA